MARIHAVKSGECLASIARAYGFANYRDIYEHASNAELRRIRPNPNLLLPGDQITIPEKSPKTEKAQTGREHTFQVKRAQTFLRLQLFESVAGKGVLARYELRLHGSPKPLVGSIMADGKLDLRVPSRATRGELTLKDPNSQEILDIIDIRLGHLDPEASASGARSRLRRLGFNCGSEEGDHLGPCTKAALALFKRNYQITEDDVLGPSTQAELVRLAGV